MLKSILPFIWPDNTLVAWFFYLAIAIVFWGALITTLVSYRRRRRELKHLQDKLQGFQSIRSESDIFRLEKELQGLSIIEDAWWEFKTALVRRGDALFAKTSFHEFFHLDSLEPSKILTPRVAASIPSTLTVLGILGTFVSLVIGLTGLNLGNQAQLQEGVGKLISSVNTAYLKSIWGVGGSVVFLFVDRWTSDQLRYQIEKMATRFDRLFVFESSESWLIQILGQQEQQTAALKAFNTDLSDAIRKELSGQIQQANSQVIEALGGMGAQVTSVARENAKGQEDAIRDVLSDVVRVFRDQMIEAVQNGMSELTHSLESVAGRMEVFGESAAEITVSMREVTGNLDSAQRSLGIAVGAVDGTLTSLSETVAVAQKAAEDSRRTIEQLVREQKNTTEILGQFDSVAGKVIGVVAALERCQKETEDAASEIADSVAALDENLTAFTERFDTVNTTLSQTAVDFAGSVRSEIEKYCVTLDSSLASASASLRTAVKDMEQTVQEMHSVLPNASTSLGTGVKSMEDAMKRLETSMTRLKPDEGSLRETTALLTVLKAWETAQKQGKQN